MAGSSAARTIPPAVTNNRAGAAAAVTGLLQQVVGAASGYIVGFLEHDGPVNLGWMMLGATTLSLLALVVAAKTTNVRRAGGG